MALSKAFKEIALRLQEDLELSHGDVCRTIQTELQEEYPNSYCYIEAVFGDEESGDVVYCQGGKCWRCSYEISEGDGSRSCTVDTDNAVQVIQRTAYDTLSDDDDADEGDGMTEAQRAEKYVPRFPGSEKWRPEIWSFSERFISKGERDSADAGDFAGEGKSFPILRKSDVMAAVRSIGRGVAGGQSAAKLKNKITAIAKKKGFAGALPKSWQDGDSQESQQIAANLRKSHESLQLVESAATLESIHLTEARADYEIKLIAPGAGSSAFYPAEVLQRDGPKVFKAGTHVYLNHPTAAEEAARPEGDVKNLAGVLSTGAIYQEAHAKGPGLYARMKVFADHGQMVEEKAPHVGMSIRASGIRETGKVKEGKPVLKELVSAESVDVVTHAGAGGMILTEAATSQTRQQEVSDMDAVELKKLQDTLDAQQKLIESQGSQNRILLDRALKSDARDFAREALRKVTLHDDAKERAITEALKNIPTKDGSLDETKFAEVVTAAAKEEGEYVARLTGSGRVHGMGTGATVTVITEKEQKKKNKEAKRDLKEARGVFEDLGMPEEAAKFAAKGRTA